MKFILDNGTADYRITGYQPGSIRINDEAVETSVIISPARTGFWSVASIDMLSESHLEELLTYDPEILIVGTGLQQHFPQARLLRPVIRAGIGLEVMDTAAACRTYNVLMSENRRVVAGIIIN